MAAGCELPVFPFALALERQCLDERGGRFGSPRSRSRRFWKELPRRAAAKPSAGAAPILALAQLARHRGPRQLPGTLVEAGRLEPFHQIRGFTAQDDLYEPVMRIESSKSEACDNDRNFIARPQMLSLFRRGRARAVEFELPENWWPVPEDFELDPSAFL